MALKRWIALLNAIFMLAAVASCWGEGAGTFAPRRLPHWFPYRQGWLGADGAYSVPLGKGRSLWFFDDTFVGAPAATSRKQTPAFIHNSVGISTCSGKDCSLRYFWAGGSSAKPGPIFVAPGSDWFWPLDAFIHDGTLYVALMQMHAAGSGAFGFAYSGSQLASIRNYTAPPSQWSIVYQQLNTGGRAVPGISIVADQGPGGNPDPVNPNGASYAYFFTAVGSPPYLALLRIPLNELNRLARPGNADWQYLSKRGAWQPWKDTATTLPADNAAVIRPGATEMTVRYHRSTRQWLAVYPLGLGRQAYYALSSSLTSGWGPSESLYSYPEMQPSNPNHTPNVFCYAVKEHVEFETPGRLFFTYVCNSRVEKDIVDNMNLYHPIVVTQRLPTK